MGYEEDLSRKLSCLEFVMHAPSNYFHDKTNPFPGPDTNDFKGSYIWTTLKPIEIPKAEVDSTNEESNSNMKEDDTKPRMPLTRRRKREMSDSENSNEKDDENRL